MAKKMLFKAMVMIVVLGMALSACTPAATPAPATEAPAAEAPKAEAPTAEAPKAAEPTAEVKEPVKVAAVLNLTTNQAVYGEPMHDGLEMATKEWNAKGGVDGHMIDLIIEDGADTATTALNAVNKVLEEEPIALFGTILGVQMIPMRDVIDDEEIPTVSLSGTRGWTMNDNTFAFRVGAFDGVKAPAIGKFLVEDLGAKSVGILSVANEWGNSGRDHTTAVLKSKYNITPVFETYQTTDTDMATQIKNLIGKGVEAIYVHGHPTDNAIIMRQMKELGVTIPVLYSDVAQTAVNLDITTAEVAEGIYITALALPLEDPDPKVQAWTAAYKSQYNNKTPDVYCIQQYVAANVLYEAMEAASKKGNLTRAGIVEELQNGTFEELTGTYKADDEGNMMFDFLIVQIGKNKTATVHTKVHVDPADVVYELPK